MTEYEFEKIVNKYSRLLWSVSARILDGIGNEQDVEECVADVFIDFWFAPDSFDSSRGSLKNWLCIKCRSKSIDRFRRLSSRLTDELSPELVSDILGPADAIVRKEETDRIRSAVMELEEPAREIMIRRFFLTQKPSVIASALDLPVRKVENIIFRSKKRVQDELGGRA